METIYLVYEIWFDSLENEIDRAVGYSVIGFVKTKQNADYISENSPMYTNKRCWAIEGKLPRYKIQIVNQIKM